MIALPLSRFWALLCPFPVLLRPFPVTYKALSCDFLALSWAFWLLFLWIFMEIGPFVRPASKFLRRQDTPSAVAFIVVCRRLQYGSRFAFSPLFCHFWSCLRLFSSLFSDTFCLISRRFAPNDGKIWGSRRSLGMLGLAVNVANLTKKPCLKASVWWKFTTFAAN